MEFGFYLGWGAMEGFKQELYDMSFPGGSIGEESSCNAGDPLVKQPTRQRAQQERNKQFQMSVVLILENP